MTGFQNTAISHMYGNKHFALVRAEMSISTRGEIVVSLQGRKQKSKAPVCLTMSQADAVRIGAALVERGSAEVRDTCGMSEQCGIPAECDCRVLRINSQTK